MKKLLLISFVLLSFVSFSQQRYNPANSTVSNKPYGMAQFGPTDARSYKYDSANFKWRPYVSTAEVLEYLYLPKYRSGQVSIIINTGGTLVNGVITGGTNAEWWFKDGTGDGDLILKQSGSPSGNGRPFFPVSRYGAKGDGVTDDRVAIQDAINAAAPVNGIVLFDSVGVYMVSSTTTANSVRRGLTCLNNTTIWIPQGATVKWGNSLITSGNPAQLFHIPNNTSNVFIGYPNGMGGVLDGNIEGQTCVNCYAQANGNYLIGSSTVFDGLTIQGLRLRNSFSNSINLGTGNTYGSAKNLKLEHLYAENFGEGIQAIAVDNVYANDITHVMNASMVVGDALEFAFCRDVNVTNTIARTNTGQSISVGGSGIDMYASRSWSVSNFQIHGTVYGFQIETDFGNNTKNPDSGTVSNGTITGASFSPAIITGGNISFSNVQMLDCKQNGPQLSKSTGALIIPEYRFDNIKLSGRCVFYINDPIRVTATNIGIHITQTGVGAFSIGNPILNMDGIKIRADSTIGAFFFADNSAPSGRIINVDADSVYNNARNIVMGAGANISKLTIQGTPPIKVLQGITSAITGSQVAVISQNVNSTNLPIGSRDQVVTINGQFQASFTPGDRLILKDGVDVTLPTINDQIVLQYGSDDVWREIGRSIPSVDTRQNLQDVTDRGSTTTNQITVIDSADATHLSGFTLWNKLGKFWQLGYGNNAYPQGTNLIFKHSSGSFVAIDSVANFGVGTKPATKFHIFDGARDVELRLQSTGAFPSTISHYTNNIFRSIQGFTATGDGFMYHAASNSYPYYIFPSGRIRFNNNNSSEDGSGFKAQFAESVNIIDTLRVGKTIVLRNGTKDFGLYPGSENEYVMIGARSNNGIRIITNDIPVATVTSYGVEVNKRSSDSSALIVDQSFNGTKAWMTIRPPYKGDSTVDFNWISSVNANDDGTKSNHVVKFGSNLLGLKPTRPKIYDSWESNWFSGGANYLERHYEIQLPNSTTSRLFSSTFINRGTFALSDNTWDFRGTTINFKSLTEVEMVSMTPNTMNLFGTNPYFRINDAGSNENSTFQQVGQDLNISVRRNVAFSNTLGGIRDFYLTSMAINQIADADIVSTRSTTSSIFVGALLKNSASGNLAGFRANASTGEVRIGSLSETVFPTFYSANAEAARFSLLGYFGLNTNSPTQRLHVKGQIQVDTLTTGSGSDSVLVTNNGLIKRVLQSSIGGANFYTSDGTFTSNRTVSFGGFSLNFNGNTGFGTSTISARVHALSTTEQLRLGYDASNYGSFTTGSGGEMAITATGGLNFPTGFRGGTESSNFQIAATVIAPASATARYQIGGATTTNYRIGEGSANTQSVGVGNSYVSHIIATQLANEAASGTHPLFSQFAVKPLTVTGGAATMTNAATVYIAGASNATAAANNDALWVDAGSARFSKEIKAEFTQTGTGTDSVLVKDGSNVVKAVAQSSIGGGGVNIYNSNGSLTGSRVVTQGIYDMEFLASNSRFDVTGASGMLLSTSTNNGLIQLSSGTNYIYLQGRVKQILVENSASTLTLANARYYVFTGTTTTWTLPDLLTNVGLEYTIKNAGSGNITLQRAGAIDQIYNTAATNSITVAPGASVNVVAGNSYWYTVQ